MKEKKKFTIAFVTDRRMKEEKNKREGDRAGIDQPILTNKITKLRFNQHSAKSGVNFEWKKEIIIKKKAAIFSAVMNPHILQFFKFTSPRNNQHSIKKHITMPSALVFVVHEHF